MGSLGVVAVSSASGAGSSELRRAILEAVPEEDGPTAVAPASAAADPEFEAEHIVYRPEGQQGFDVERVTEGVFEVRGRGIELLVRRHDLANPEALAYLEQRLREIGVVAALRARASSRATRCGSATRSSSSTPPLSRVPSLGREWTLSRRYAPLNSPTRLLYGLRAQVACQLEQDVEQRVDVLGRVRQLTIAGRKATLPSKTVVPANTRPSRISASPRRRLSSSSSSSAAPCGPPSEADDVQRHLGEPLELRLRVDAVGEPLGELEVALDHRAVARPAVGAKRRPDRSARARREPSGPMKPQFGRGSSGGGR